MFAKWQNYLMMHFSGKYSCQLMDDTMCVYTYNEWQQWYKEQEGRTENILLLEGTIQPVKWYSVICKWTWTNWKGPVRTLGQPLKNVIRKYNWYAKKGKKMES